MTTILSTRINQFRLYDKYYDDDSYYCDVTVQIEKKRYIDNKEFYDISYFYSCSEESHRCFNLIPLKKDNMTGEIIAANSLTDKLCEYLLMDMNELKKHSGNVSVQIYKESVMNMITYLDD